MTKVYDAVIIGAGHNSLACAIHLAAKGWSVGLFEQAPHPGGAVHTEALTLPDFRHDWAAMNLSLFAGSAFFKAYGDGLAKHGLEFVPVSKPFASAFPDGRWLGISTDPAATAAGIRGFSPEDAETWAALATAFSVEAESVLGLLGSPMRNHALAATLFRIWRRKGMAGTLDFAQFLLSSPRAWLTRTFRSEHLRATLGAWGLHLDFAPDIAGGAVFPYLEGMAAQAFGMVIGKGGADTIISAMAADLAARGAHLECNAEVTQILHSGGKASGIRLADGRTITARKAVIANVAPVALARLTGSTGNRVFDAKMQAFDHAPGTLMLHLALDGLPDWAASDDLKSFAYVHLAPSLDQMACTYTQAKAGLLPDEPAIVVGQPTVFDPSRAPEGKHVLWMQVRMVPGTIKGDAAGQITATDWADVAEPMAERALDILNRYAPGIRTKILARTIVSPSQLAAQNPNLVGGDQVCGSHHLAQNFMFRPARGHADGATPIDRLHLTGAAVWPGAGTGAGAGFHLARKLAGK